MTWTQAIIVYTVCWWLMLFMALPIGIKSQDQIVDGLSRAAPQKTHLKIKCIAVSVLTLGVTYAIALLVDSGWIQVR